MNYAIARALAEEELALARQLNASSEHPETAKRARFCSVILDLCSQIEQLTPVNNTPPPILDSTPADEPAPTKRGRPRKEAGLGVVGGE